MKALAQSLVLLTALCAAAGAADLRPPAWPLLTHDPYFSVWLFGDRLNGARTSHWSGARQELNSYIRIDGETFRLMGLDPRWKARKQSTEPLPQTGSDYTATRSVFGFEGHGVRVDVQFLSPMPAHDLDLVSRPASYVTWVAASADGRPHDVQLYFAASGDLARHDETQPLDWGRYSLGEATALRVGTNEQNILGRRGDNVRMDWGYLYLTASPEASPQFAAASQLELWQSFRASGTLPPDDLEPDVMPGKPRTPAIGVAWDLGRVQATPVRRTAIVAYDDLFSIEYFHRRLRPWWRRNGDGAAEMLRAALREQRSVYERAAEYDGELEAYLTRTGGEEYADVALLAYRQTLAAHKLVAGPEGEPLLLSKENFSNGSIGTVDVMYPASPFFLLLSPELQRAQMRPVMDYAASGRWPFDFAPHDLGTYPIANGQTYGGGEETEDDQMPVEESANMILQIAGLAAAEDDPGFAEQYWALLAKWAAYLRDKGFDPEEQLSTDDFTGHLAHNTNLSLKAIVALGAYAQLCGKTGRSSDAGEYRRLAEELASRWVREADDGDHFRLTFDKPGTWSQKYNLIWDRILGLQLFPAEVAEKEIAYYEKVQNEYGLPLDNRSQFTKLDWIYWSASLADSDADFEALTEPVHRFLDETPDRVPMTDWYWTQDARRRGFQARSVVGGVYVRMLLEPAVWKRWASLGTRP
ncbi:MAG: DUF4965 domain-containing protein [Acidobacteria bacterium]|nr:DUF4965 domain-containing protein [Acidobacteriota bacterium]